MYLEEKELVNNKKFNSYHKGHLADSFIILDDKVKPIDDNIIKIFNEIKKYNYDINVCDIEKIAVETFKKYSLRIGEFDTIVTTGTGGKKVCESLIKNNLLKDKEIYYIKWNRVWTCKCYFDTNIDELNIKNKKILVLEDVIASGKTMYNFVNKLSFDNDVVGVLNILIQESSPLAKKSFIPIYSGIMIKCLDPSLDPYWFPPIYSLRHLLFGDDETSNFYSVLSEKYFKNENSVEKIIKEVRKKI